MKCNNNKQDKYKKIICPRCSSTNLIKRGLRKTKNRGKIQRYYCKDCDKRFVQDLGFFKMKNAPQKVTLCIDLFFKGVSLRKIQEHLQAFYPANSSHMSIYRWIVKYSKMIGEYTDKLKLNVGSELQVDEMEYHRLGNKNWFIDCIDTETRYIVSSKYFEIRGQKELISVISKAKMKTENQTQLISTDGLLAYPNAVKKVYGYYNLKNKVINHNIKNASRGDGFNCRVERLHNTIRERTKIFRGFHGCIESAYSIMKGYEVFYNFIRKHQALGCCPYEIAVPQLRNELEVPNKWLKLIELSTENN